MTKCKYWDCGFCYAPDDVKTNALGNGGCIHSECCPYLKSQNQMTNETDIAKVLIEGDTATIMGVKYQRIIEPQSFYDKLYGLLQSNLDERVDTEEITIRVLNLIEENIPKPYEGVGLPEYSVGWNDALHTIKEKLR
jgi:hypothetical protein